MSSWWSWTVRLLSVRLYIYTSLQAFFPSAPAATQLLLRLLRLLLGLLEFSARAKVWQKVLGSSRSARDRTWCTSWRRGEQRAWWEMMSETRLSPRRRNQDKEKHKNRFKLQLKHWEQLQDAFRSGESGASCGRRRNYSLPTVWAAAVIGQIADLHSEQGSS